MRVIAGKFRSRVLVAPPGMDTRPTTDRLRETLFNVLTNGAVDRVEGKAFLDLYAGSGAVGIEALSRGAASVTFVESGAAALGALRKNLDSLGIRTGFALERRSVAAFLRREAEKLEEERTRAVFSVVYLDPPWDLAAEYAATLGWLGGAGSGLLAEDALVVAEHRRKDELEAEYGCLSRTRVLEQGDAGLSFFAKS
jgi:16S rRNA (guanine(966)-N(2))-methyltransferase RsmD